LRWPAGGVFSLANITVEAITVAAPSAHIVHPRSAFAIQQCWKTVLHSCQSSIKRASEPSLNVSVKAAFGEIDMCGCMQDPQVCKATDQGQLTYRDYLMRRLRVPAGVVFGHGLMDLALIHGSEEVDSAVMQRLQANSLAELEHLFLEFYQELLQVCLSVWGPSIRLS